jgi:23S rRNA (guanosine2251-2'-O)-methyltransferase
LWGRRPVLEYLRSGGLPEKIFFASETSGSHVLAEIRDRSRKIGASELVVSRLELDRLAPGNHQGVVAVAGPYRYTPLESVFAEATTGILFADGIMDPQNLGSLIRSALGAGFNAVVIPARRAAGVTSTVRRVSAGAAELLSVARAGNLARAIEQAKAAGLWVVGLDEKAQDALWVSELMDPPVALVVGAEDRGISRSIRLKCDGLVKIPQQGELASLNAGVAGAVAMFEVARRLKADENEARG